MQDIKYYNPLFIYRHDILQKVLDSLSRMLDLREEEEPADTKRFYIIQDFLVIKEEDSDQS